MLLKNLSTDWIKKDFFQEQLDALQCVSTKKLRILASQNLRTFFKKTLYLCNSEPLHLKKNV